MNEETINKVLAMLLGSGDRTPEQIEAAEAEYQQLAKSVGAIIEGTREKLKEAMNGKDLAFCLIVEAGDSLIRGGNMESEHLRRMCMQAAITPGVRGGQTLNKGH